VPDPLVKTGTEILPDVVIHDTEKKTEPKLSPAKERPVSELRKLQAHDPDVVLMRGGGCGGSSTMLGCGDYAVDELFFSGVWSGGII
jgi:hypothetical protein